MRPLPPGVNEAGLKDWLVRWRRLPPVATQPGLGGFRAGDGKPSAAAVGRPGLKPAVRAAGVQRAMPVTCAEARAGKDIPPEPLATARYAAGSTNL